MDQRRKLELNKSAIKNGDVADVTVVGDGGWGKRSLGHSYDSLTGNCFIQDLTCSCRFYL